MQEFEIRFGQWVLASRWWIIVVTLLLVGFAASGCRYLYFSTNLRVFFGEDNPQLLTFESLEKTYTKNNSVLFTLAPRGGQVFNNRTLSAIEELTERAWQTPYSIRVDSVTNFQYSEARGDDIVVRDLVDGAMELQQSEIATIQKIAINEPQLLGRLISDRGHVAGVEVTIQLPDKNVTSGSPEVVRFARQLADEVRTHHPEIDVYLSGLAMLNGAFSEATRSDMTTLVPLSFSVMLLVLVLLLRNLAGVVSVMIVILLSVGATMGLGGYMGIPISPPVAVVPTAVLTMAIANCVHVWVSFQQEMAYGRKKDIAMLESLRINLQPVSLASLTTCLGFLSLNFSDAPPFWHMGNLVAISVSISFVLAVMFLPAFVSLLPVRVRSMEGGDDTLMTRVGELVVRHRRALLWGGGLLTAVLVSAVPRNELNDVFHHYFDKTVQFRADSDFTAENLTGVNSIEYSIESGEAGGINDPRFLEDVAAFTEWFRRQPEVIHVKTLTDIMKRLNKNMHEDKPGWYRLPEDRQLAAQYLLLYEMSLPYGLDLNNEINIDKSSIRLVVTLKTLSTNGLLGLEQRATQWLNEHVSHLKVTDGSGMSMIFAHLSRRNIVGMLSGTTLALLLLSLILVKAFHSLKIGLISLLPNLIPAAMGFGLWGLWVGEVGLALSVVTGMTLGIVVDDTVHFLSKYLRARREYNYGAAQAVVYAFRTAGQAMLITSTVLIAGFLVLSVSSYEINAGMGLLTAIVIAFALLADFLLLPPLLIKVEEKNEDKMAHALIGRDTSV